MTYNVFSGTLNPIQSVIQALIELSLIRMYVLRIFDARICSSGHEYVRVCIATTSSSTECDNEYL